MSDELNIKSRAKTASAHPEVQRALIAMGEQIRAARVARDITIADMATRVGVQPGTIRRLETGAPGVAADLVGRVLWTMGLLDHLQTIAASERDPEGQRLAALRAPQRARGRATTKKGRDWSALDRI